MRTIVSRSKFTPPELARQWGISPDKVLRWIRSGELPAMNAATKAGSRPRYLIDAADVAAFEARRSVTSVQRPRYRRRVVPPNIIEFF